LGKLFDVVCSVTESIRFGAGEQEFFDYVSMPRALPLIPLGWANELRLRKRERIQISAAGTTMKLSPEMRGHLIARPELFQESEVPLEKCLSYE